MTFVAALQVRSPAFPPGAEWAKSTCYKRPTAKIGPMPVVYKLNPADKFIYTQCIGNVTPAEISEHFRELVRDPDCPDRLTVLLDLTETTSVPWTYEIRGVNQDLESVRGKVAFDACAVVASKIVLFGMMRMFAVLAQRHFTSIRVFRTVPEAEEWLAAQRSPV